MSTIATKAPETFFNNHIESLPENCILGNTNSNAFEKHLSMYCLDIRKKKCQEFHLNIFLKLFLLIL